MKKVFVFMMVVIISFGICACNSGGQNPTGTPEDVAANEGVDQVVDIEEYPFVGSWINERGKNCFRFKEDGTSLMEAVANKTEGSGKSFFIYKDSSYTWSVKDGKFFINDTEFTPIINNGVYKLVGEKVVYIRVGELDYELDLRFVVEENIEK